MILIVDAGSTKADWFLGDKGKVVEKYRTDGFNPYFHSSDFIYESLMKTELRNISGQIKKVNYFGAGCSSPARVLIVEIGLQRFFPKAEISVQHDLLAAALATCGDEAGISCILGTGSNSCYFDGKELHEKNYGLGYILGDEGSGSYYGKKLVTSFLYGTMPENIHQHFKEEYNLDKDAIITKVYSTTDANVWLASLSRFMSKYRSDPYIHKLIDTGMREFIDLYVCGHKQYKEVPVHFVGSIAFLYQEELKAAINDYPVTQGKIIQRPIEELTNYFLLKHAEA